MLAFLARKHSGEWKTRRYETLEIWAELVKKQTCWRSCQEPSWGLVNKIWGTECTWGFASKFGAPARVRNEQKSETQMSSCGDNKQQKLFNATAKMPFLEVFSSIENWNVSNLYVKQLKRLEEVKSARSHLVIWFCLAFVTFGARKLWLLFCQNLQCTYFYFKRNEEINNKTERANYKHGCH